MKTILFLAAFILCCLDATANENAPHTSTLSISWINPTMNTDSTQIADVDHGALAYTEITYSICNENNIDWPNAKTHLVAADREQTTISVEGAAGEYCVVAQSVNSDGQKSDISNLVSKSIENPVADRDFTVPTPPTELAIGSDPTVYTIVRQPDKFLLLPVGTVPPNTPCIIDQSINGYNAVPVDQVQWTGSVRPVIVVAKCF